MRLEKHIETVSEFASGQAGAVALQPLMKDHAHPGQRANVYRNSGILACVEALRSNYSRLARMMGDEFFGAMARAYVASKPPSVRSLVGYGASLPPFLAAADSQHGLPWLSNLALLDRAWLAAHLASDARPLSADSVARHGPDALMHTLIDLSPSARLVETDWGLTALWSALDAGNAPSRETPIPQRTEYVLFWRPDGEVRMRQLSHGEYTFLQSLARGHAIGAACEMALSAQPDIDLSSLIAGTFASGIFVNATSLQGTSQ
ncbi:DNA-binding domain-containing protein [Hyphomonas johnsonii]|uniref:Putative DNA-binding domain-containing protein n=1 Tax=Hyphomonas johnsonii MHS-2 TaxID=1280950 RepID=A0A059FSJ1_9PROT|nr:DNA-binding domain-containing protein [Hyphomonas johnsonii]KCZ93476.1 hypothetical protein HJO_06465 [Hyphomonas johnsonii MHS-2]